MGAVSGAASGAAAGSVAGPIGAGVGAVVGGLAGWLGGRSQKKAEEDARRLANEYAKADKASREQIELDLIANGWNPGGINQLRSMASEVSSRSGTSTTTGMRKYVAFDPELDRALGNILKTNLAQPQLMTAAEKAAVLQGLAGNARDYIHGMGNVIAGKGGTQADRLAADIEGRSRLAHDITAAQGKFAQTDFERQAQARAEADAYAKARAGEKSKSTTNFSEMGSSTRTGMNEVGPDIGALAALRAPAQLVSMNTGISPLSQGIQGAMGGASAGAGIASMFGRQPTGQEQMQSGLNNWYGVPQTQIPLGGRRWDPTANGGFGGYVPG